MTEFKIGDPIEVSYPQFDNCVTREFHRPATICHIDGERFGVAFADGTRMMLERRAKNYRVLSVDEVE